MARKQIGSTYWLELTLNTRSVFTHVTDQSQQLNELFTVHVYDSETGGNEVTDLFDITNDATGEITKVELNWLDEYAYEYTYNNVEYQCKITHNITHNDSELADSELSNSLCTGQITSNVSESIILRAINDYASSLSSLATFNDVLDVLGLDVDENNNITNIASMFANNSAPIAYETNNTELIINIDNTLYTRKTGFEPITSISSLVYDTTRDSGGAFLKCTIEKNPRYNVTNMPSGSTWSIDYDYDLEELTDVDENYTFYLLIQSSAGKQTITLSGTYRNTYNGSIQNPLDNDDITISIN